MRTEITREAATASRPKRTAAPAGVSSPRVNGSARTPAVRAASVSIERNRFCTVVCALSQVSAGAAASAALPGVAASALSSMARTSP